MVRYVFFPLHPDTPPEGRSLRSLFAGRGVDLEEMHRRLADLMRHEGLPYGERTHTYNSRLAQELGTWAETRPGGQAIHDALYRAYFVDGRNIGDVDVLVRVAEAAGLSGADAELVLRERRYQAAVDADWARAQRCGVTGVPTFIAGEAAVVGAQPEEVLERLVTMAGARASRPPSAPPAR